MAKYIDVEPLINDGWQLQRCNSGDGYVNQEHASLKDIPPADVRPVRRGRWEWKHRHRGGFRRVTGEDDFGVRHTITVDQRYEIDDPYYPFCKKLNESVFLNFCPNCGSYNGADMMGGDADGDEKD